MALDIDRELVSAGMGRYQLINCALFCLVIMYSNLSPTAYIFTAADLNYRCEIPDCDSPDPAARTYQPDWLRFTTPYRDDTGLPKKCERYVSVGNGTRCELEKFDDDDDDGNATERCDGGPWVFEHVENTVGTEFGLMCEENKWKLSSVGTVNNLGQFIGVPVSGIVADKFGRKFTMVVIAATSSTICIIQSYSVSYPMFLAMELLSSTVSSGMYVVTFVLAMEVVLPKQRVLYYSILECFNPLGAVAMALIASRVKDWRLLLRISNVPGLLFLSYFWLTEESIRWLEMQGEHGKVIDVLKKIANTNKRPLPDLSPDARTEQNTGHGEDVAGSNEVKSNTNILKDVIRSPTIFWRMVRCSFVWIAAALIFYGLTIGATDIAGNKYLNFTLVELVEIPACLLYWLIMENMSRKMSLCSMFLLTGTTCAAFNLMSNELVLIKLSLFLVSKLAISIAFAIIYMQTAEIFPTQMRVTLMSVCSMISRIGSMMAPQTSLLAQYFGGYVPMLLFGATAIAAAAVTATLPESKNVKLPDTVDEAERIGNVDGGTRPEVDAGNP